MVLEMIDEVVLGVCFEAHRAAKRDATTWSSDNEYEDDFRALERKNAGRFLGKTKTRYVDRSFSRVTTFSGVRRLKKRSNASARAAIDFSSSRALLPTWKNAWEWGEIARDRRAEGQSSNQSPGSGILYEFFLESLMLLLRPPLRRRLPRLR